LGEKSSYRTGDTTGPNGYKQMIRSASTGHPFQGNRGVQQLTRCSALFLIVLYCQYLCPPTYAQLDGQTVQVAPGMANIEALAVRVQESLVVIEGTGRSGAVHGEGSGFAIGPDLIATARHVIGEGRHISVVLPDGERPTVIAIHSQMAHLDMVVLRTEPHGLPTLELSQQEAVPGLPTVALGHPHGLRNSVVSGVVSGTREIDGHSMIQLAMAIEPGNSGGPVVNHDGDVIGMVTLKSTASDNIGFALPVSHLQSLLNSPNPVLMERWVTIGALDGKRWTAMFGANWTQRAGRILVEGQGTGFGGRTLCLFHETPDLPIELEVAVRLQDERGAAGLVIHSDGHDRHYGFYPSGGNIRFTRFNGPDLNHWTILHNARHSSYRPNDWNTLKVQIDETGMVCSVNGELAVQIVDTELAAGQPGLVAFRGTEASFRHFQMAGSIPSTQPSAEQRQQVTDLLDEQRASSNLHTKLIRDLSSIGQGVNQILEDRAAELEQQAVMVRQLADDVHTNRIIGRLRDVLNLDNDQDQQPDLLHAALLLAQLDNPEVRPEFYIRRVNAIAQEILKALPDDADDSQRLQALDRWLFQLNGFRGSENQYYTSSNSYLNEVIDDREGLPIALSVLYIEIARRLNLNVQGVGLPGHFIVRYDRVSEPPATEWIDVFHRGSRMSDDAVEQHLSERGLQPDPRFTEAQQPVAIIERMLRNLLGLAERDREDRRVLRYLEVLVAVAPEEPEYRAKRLEMRARTGHRGAALEDANWFIEHRPHGIDLQQLQRIRAQLQSDTGR